MTMIFYTLAGVALYGSADWLLDRIVRSRGRRCPHRTLAHFGILPALTHFTSI